MPTATAINSWSLTNLGPLTTTFTAPLSCSTLHNNVIIGHNVTDSDTHTTFFEPEGALCGIGTSVRSCLPSGSLLDSEYNSYTKNPDPRYGWTINYFSPGLICPSDWETVGVATKSVGGSITSSGPAFVYPSVIPTAGIYYEDLRDPSPNALLEAMSEGESAILCCPSDYTADTDGQCTSTLPSDFSIPSVICFEWVNGNDTQFVNTTLSVFGTTLIGTVNVVTGSVPYSTETQTLDAATLADEPGATGYVAVTYQDALFLVHTATETASAGATGAASTERAGPLAIIMLLSLVTAFTSGFLVLEV